MARTQEEESRHRQEAIEKMVRELKVRRRSNKPDASARRLIRDAAQSMHKGLNAGLKTLSEEEKNAIECYCALGGTFIFLIQWINGRFRPILRPSNQRKAPITPNMKAVRETLRKLGGGKWKKEGA